MAIFIGTERERNAVLAGLEEIRDMGDRTTLGRFSDDDISEYELDRLIGDMEVVPVPVISDLQIAQRLLEVFPWLAVDDEEVSGADVVENLVSFYEVLLRVRGER